MLTLLRSTALCTEGEPAIGVNQCQAPGLFYMGLSQCFSDSPELLQELSKWETLTDYSLCDSQSQFMTVLIVEDHADTRSVLEVLLNRCGCQILTAKSLKEAHARLKEMPFDLIITDLNLPDGDGLDLVREAKQRHKLKAIAITGRASNQERDQGLQAGVDYYLTKPIDYQQLKNALFASPNLEVNTCSRQAPPVE